MENQVLFCYFLLRRAAGIKETTDICPSLEGRQGKPKQTRTQQSMPDATTYHETMKRFIFESRLTLVSAARGYPGGGALVSRLMHRERCRREDPRIDNVKSTNDEEARSNE